MSNGSKGTHIVLNFAFIQLYVHHALFAMLKLVIRNIGGIELRRVRVCAMLAIRNIKLNRSEHFFGCETPIKLWKTGGKRGGGIPTAQIFNSI